MANIPAHLRYTKDHEWIELQSDGTAVVGITEYAQEALGDLVFIELPKTGAGLSVGDEFAVVESVKAASEVYAPISGKVTEVNEDLSDNPAAINESPYDDGWMIKMTVADKKEIETGTMSADEYAGYLDKLN
ncbi:MAG: glycine cleavage system protein GcvH [Proteobacteria bacterium]|nr:glycine cleavage system protein GcvH [Pseudomonadota bacterium]